MNLTKKQQDTIKDIVDSFTKHRANLAFTCKPHKLYYDKEKDSILLVSEFTTTNINHMLNEFGMSIIDKKGKVTPLANAIGFLNERLKYISTLELIKTYE